MAPQLRAVAQRAFETVMRRMGCGVDGVHRAYNHRLVIFVSGGRCWPVTLDFEVPERGPWAEILGSVDVARIRRKLRELEALPSATPTFGLVVADANNEMVHVNLFEYAKR